MNDLYYHLQHRDRRGRGQIDLFRANPGRDPVPAVPRNWYRNMEVRADLGRFNNELLPPPIEERINIMRNSWTMLVNQGIAVNINENELFNTFMNNYSSDYVRILDRVGYGRIRRTLRDRLIIVINRGYRNYILNNPIMDANPIVLMVFRDGSHTISLNNIVFRATGTTFIAHLDMRLALYTCYFNLCRGCGIFVIYRIENRWAYTFSWLENCTIDHEPLE